MSAHSVRKRDSTKHHVVPYTLGGSDESVNLMDGVPRQEHNCVHAWLSNKPPCFGFRTALLHAIGGEFCPEPEVLEHVLQITTMPNWYKLYDPDAFVPVSASSAPEKAKKSREFQITFWKEEELLIRNVLHALLNGRDFPVQTQSGAEFQSRILVSMKSENLRDAMEEMLTHPHKGNRLRWVNPIREVTRIALLGSMTSMPRRSRILDPKSRSVQADFERILERQKKSLTSYTSDAK